MKLPFEFISVYKFIVFLGKERMTSSKGIIAQVSGKPQILKYRTDETVWVPKHSNGNIDVIFCSNPKYKRLFWEWGVVPNVVQMQEGMKIHYKIGQFGLIEKLPNHCQ